MNWIPDHVASKREQRDTKIVIMVVAVIVLFAFISALVTGSALAWIAVVLFSGVGFIFCLADMLQPKA